MFPIINPNDHEQRWGGLMGPSASMGIAYIAENSQTPCLVITEDLASAEKLHTELKYLTQNSLPVALFPDWETLAYDHFSPHQDIISTRIGLLSRIQHWQNGIIIASVTTLMHRLAPREYIQGRGYSIKINETLDPEEFKQQLVFNGYRHVSLVMEHGEFSSRGAIIDFFPMGTEKPYRIEFFDNLVETIRRFDPDTQISFDKENQIELLTAHEFPLDDESIKRFRQAWREHMSGNPNESPLYLSISEGRSAPGIEYYLSLFFEKLGNFFDYLNPKSTVILLGNIQSSFKAFRKEIDERYNQLRYDVRKPLCPIENIYLSEEEFFRAVNSIDGTKYRCHSENKPNDQVSIQTQILPNLQVDSKSKSPFSKLSAFCALAKEKHERILFITESAGRREILLDQLKRIDLNSITPKQISHIRDFLQPPHESFGIVTAPFEQGISLPELGVHIICENDLFGEKMAQRRDKKQRVIDPNLMIRDLTELTIGSPVVHLNHGVGRYLGLETIKTDNLEAEYLTLEYANKDRIYVPVSSLQLISRYTGADADHAPLQRLGNKQWERDKQKTVEQIRDTAAELLDVYVRRQAATGFPFKLDQEEYQRFSQGFPFEETPDQAQAIKQVINDMCSPRVMDRLVCGDVGFGKTEVAMRAAFIAVQNGKQVAMLAPTTLLAHQHAQNFQDRFADWPIKIAELSRLHGSAEAKKIITGLKEGKIDIVIGTHKLLSPDIQFKDLGLLIVDEEQRFGVHQKERIAQLRAELDMLTLTATPIPRTLNMALAGTRDLSIIATPPPRRLSVKTFIHEHSPTLIREAILREILRGGQVYYLHNDVSTMPAYAEKLQEIVPEAKIKIAHGQMRERELEKVMSEFYHHHIHVLLCSTIIESGIDVPSANTIIIDRADKLGLAQLHQLRGRVGRSHHQAYAYLITPPEKSLTKDAQKRMAAIAELGDLGIGFSLASYDLEIRGAGELLGDQQSGHIQTIGFSLYMELLEEAVSALKRGEEPLFKKPLNSGVEIDLGISALFPENYIGDVTLRLTLYKRLSNCQNEEELQDLKAELIDRFGALPTATQNLIDVTHLKLISLALGIEKIELGKQFGYIQFNEKPSINLTKLVELIQKQAKKYQLQGSSKLRFVHDTDKPAFELIKEIIFYLK
jgi:transcription-repair coupling factor (superfamily II helicase)